MRKLLVFESISVDGFFAGLDGDLSFAHAVPPDPEWDGFVANNASGPSSLVFGRITYEMMASFWPTPFAAEQMPEVAAGMNRSEKIVFSTTLESVGWANTRLLDDDPVDAIRRLKAADGPAMVILGSGSLVAQLAPAGLIDEYQLVVVPVILGAGRTLFEGVEPMLPLQLTHTRAFANGNVVLTYASRAMGQE